MCVVVVAVVAAAQRYWLKASENWPGTVWRFMEPPVGQEEEVPGQEAPPQEWLLTPAITSAGAAAEAWPCMPGWT